MLKLYKKSIYLYKYAVIAFQNHLLQLSGSFFELTFGKSKGLHESFGTPKESFGLSKSYPALPVK